MIAVLGISGIIIGIITFFVGRSQMKKETKMAGNIITLIGIIAILSQSFVIINPGEVGVQVFFGRVLDTTLRDGFNLKNPFIEIVTFEVRLQEYTLSSIPNEGDVIGDDAIKVITRDNLELTIDLSVWYTINADLVTDIYKNIAKNNIDLKAKIIRPSVRNVTRNVATKYSFKETIEKREQFSQEMEFELKEIIDTKGITTDRVLIRKVDPPQSVKNSIENKLVQEQNLETKALELDKAAKDAEIRTVTAQGIADAQAIIQDKLTPLYIQYEAVQAYKELANSNNTTFVIAPTSATASGMPLILDLNQGK
ncbi:prohibitin family protein [bacterium]|nr:prohibitin family protein [bacterium]